MKHTTSLLLIGLSAVTPAIAASVNVSLLQEVHGTEDATVFNVTELGNLDWFVFTSDMGLGTLTPENSKSTGTAFTSLETIGSPAAQSDLFGSGETNYSYTDGTSPIAGTAGAFDRIDANNDGDGLRLVAAVPAAGVYELKFFASTAQNIALIATATLSSDSTTDSFTSTNDDQLNKYEFTIRFTTDDADTLTLDVTKESGNNNIFAFEAATLSQVPEPSSALLLGLSALALLKRRR